MNKQQSIEAVSKQPNKAHLLYSNTSVSSNRVDAGINGSLNIPQEHARSVLETPNTYNINAFSTIASTAPNQSGQAFVDLKLENVNVLRNCHVNATFQNSHGSSAHVWEAPVMPFMIRRIEVMQGSRKIGNDILPIALWKWIGYTQETSNKLRLIEARTTIDRTTYALQSSQNLASGASRTYSIDIAPLLPFVDARINLQYCKGLSLRIYIEDIAVVCPTNTNSTNSSILLTNLNLTVTDYTRSRDVERREMMEYQKGHVEGRFVEYREELASFSAVSGSNVQYVSNAFNNEPVIYSDVALRNSSGTGANLLTYYDVNTMYLTTQDGVNLHNGLQMTSSELLNVIYPQALPDNVFTKATNIFLFPAIVGATDVKKSLMDGCQSGYKVFPHRAIVNVNATATATRTLVISAWLPKICRVDNQGLMYVF